MAGVWFWISLVVGSLFGLMFTLAAGLGKILPAHPMYKMMEPGFAKVMGPFFGFPGAPLRIILGLAYVCAGLGLLGGLWGEFLKKIDGDLLALDQALLVCVPIGIITIHLGALWYHLAIEQNPGPPAMFIPMMGLFLYSRLQISPYETMSAKNQTVIQGFSGVCLVGLVLAVIARCACGAQAEELRQADKDLKAAAQTAAE